MRGNPSFSSEGANDFMDFLIGIVLSLPSLPTRVLYYKPFDHPLVVFTPILFSSVLVLLSSLVLATTPKLPV